MADKVTKKRDGAEVRRKRVRGKVSGATARPRLTVCKTLKHIYAQVIDDSSGVTLAAASTVTKSIKSDVTAATTKVAEAKLVGMALAEAAKAKGITQVVFDRNRFRYHGRVKAVADGAREGGLLF